jgi:hypothetical protein
MCGMRLFAQDTSESFIRTDNSDMTVIDHKNVDILSFGEFEGKLKNITYVPLVTKKHIRQFSKVIHCKDKIYVFDFDYKSLNIHIFSAKGEFVRIITSIQFKDSFRDITVSEDENCLIALATSASLYYFTLDGQFIKKTNGLICSEIAALNDKIIVNMAHPMMKWNLKRDFNLALTDSNMNVIRQGFPFCPVNHPANDAKSDIVLHRNFKNELLFSPALSDTVYQIIDESKYTVKYVLEQEKSIWTKYNEKLTSTECSKLQIQSGYTYRTGNFLETENFINYSISYGSDEYGVTYPAQFWYDKRTKKTFAVGQKTQSDERADAPDNLDNSAIMLEPVIIEVNRPIKHIISMPEAVSGNRYTGVFSNIKALKKALKNPQSYDYKYFKNEEIKKMVSEIKNLDAILVLYELK